MHRVKSDHSSSEGRKCGSILDSQIDEFHDENFRGFGEEKKNIAVDSNRQLSSRIEST